MIYFLQNLGYFHFNVEKFKLFLVVVLKNIYFQNRSARTNDENDAQKLTGKRVQLTFDCINRDMDRTKIKHFFEQYARVKSVHYTKLQVMGYVMFYDEENLEKNLAPLVNTKLSIDGAKCQMKILHLTTFVGNKL